MKTSIYNSFKLLGYKINELSNGYFITKSPVGRESLFDAQGNVILQGKYTIQHVYPNLYITSNSNIASSLTLYDEKGKELDTGDSDEFNFATENYLMGGFLKVEHNDKLEGRYYNVYGNKRNIIFSKIRGIPRYIVYNGSKSKLVYTDDDYNMHLIDMKGNDKAIDLKYTQVYSYNKQYIRYAKNPFQDAICDYNLKDIYLGNNIEIDTSIRQSDTICVFHREKSLILILDKNGKTLLSRSYSAPELHNCISKVYYTSETNIICIKTLVDKYFLMDMTNGNKSKMYDNIDINKFIGDNVQSSMEVSLIDKDTLTDIKVIKGVKVVTNTNAVCKITRKDDTGNIVDENYTNTLKKLRSEF